MEAITSSARFCSCILNLMGMILLPKCYCLLLNRFHAQRACYMYIWTLTSRVDNGAFATQALNASFCSIQYCNSGHSVGMPRYSFRQENRGCAGNTGQKRNASGRDSFSPCNFSFRMILVLPTSACCPLQPGRGCIEFPVTASQAQDPAAHGHLLPWRRLVP